MLGIIFQYGVVGFSEPRAALTISSGDKMPNCTRFTCRKGAFESVVVLMATEYYWWPTQLVGACSPAGTVAALLPRHAFQLFTMLGARVRLGLQKAKKGDWH